MTGHLGESCVQFCFSPTSAPTQHAHRHAHARTRLFLTRLDSLIRIIADNPPVILRSGHQGHTHTQEQEQDVVASSIYSFSGLTGDDTVVSAVASQGCCSRGCFKGLTLTKRQFSNAPTNIKAVQVSSDGRHL